MAVTDEIQRRAKALGDPSRFRLFRHLVERAAPVGVAELTDLLGLNHNAIRQHLAVLVDAGLVTEANERRTTPGRPRKQYRARQDALDAFGAVAGSYQRLSELLLEVATGSGEPYDVGLRAAEGPSAPAANVPDQAAAIADLVEQLAVDGYRPTADDRGRIVLGRCPFADVAARDQAVICELHRGLIDGHLRRGGNDLQSRLQPRDPHQAGCEIRIDVASGQ